MSLDMSNMENVEALFYLIANTYNGLHSGENPKSSNHTVSLSLLIGALNSIKVPKHLLGMAMGSACLHSSEGSSFKILPGIVTVYGIGDVNPITGFYSHIVGYSLTSMESLDFLQFQPIILLNLRNPNSVATIKKFVTDVASGIVVEWDEDLFDTIRDSMRESRTRADKQPDEFTKFMQGLMQEGQENS